MNESNQPSAADRGSESYEPLGAWRPIETAPQDGTWVLLTGGEIDYGWHFFGAKPPMVVGRWISEDPVRVEFKRWHFAWYDSGFYGEYESPTHWMPLPTTLDAAGNRLARQGQSG